MTQPAPGGSGFSQFQASQGSTPGGTAPTVAGAAPSAVFPTESIIDIPGNNLLADHEVPGLSTPGHQVDVPGNSRMLQMGLTNPEMQGGGPLTFRKALYRLLGNQNEDQVKALQERLIKAGYLDPTAQSFIPGQVGMDDETYSAYAAAMADSITKQENFDKLLRSRIKNPDNKTGQAYWNAYQQILSTGGTNTTATSTSVNLSDATQSRAAAQSQYESLLGRNLNDHEAAAFHSALNSYESANPNVTSQTDTHAAGSNVSTSSTTSSGGASDPEQFAEAYIMQNEPNEYAKTQGDQIYNLFASMLGGR